MDGKIIYVFNAGYSLAHLFRVLERNVGPHLVLHFVAASCLPGNGEGWDGAMVMSSIFRKSRRSFSNSTASRKGKHETSRNSSKILT